MMRSRNSEEPVNVINIIGEGTEIKGDIIAKGDIRINGRLIGNLFTESKLILGETGYIEGQIKAKNADISGKVKGKIEISELIIFRETANFEGDLITKKLVIEEGAIFNGTCKMDEKITLEPNKKKVAAK